MTSKEDPLGLEVGASPKEMISGVEDWGVPRRVARTDGGLGDVEPFEVFASVRVASSKLGET